MANKATRYLPMIARYLMAFLFVVTGLNGFFHFFRDPPNMPEFAGALVKTGYMFPLIMGTQLVFGVLMALNLYVPLALALIAPVVVNIVAFHLFLDRGGLPVAFVVLALEIFLAWSYRDAYRPMLRARNSPGI